MAVWKDSMINRLSNLINRNRSAAKISQVLLDTSKDMKSPCCVSSFLPSLPDRPTTGFYPIPNSCIPRFGTISVFFLRKRIFEVDVNRNCTS